MTENNTLDLIVEQWIASLRTKDRSHKGVRDNFEELFDALKVAEATSEEAHGILPRVVKAHLPPPAVVHNVYRRAKSLSQGSFLTEKEYLEDWHNSIKDTATQVFFEFFPIGIADDDKGPKVFGNVSEKEYRAQRRYADQFEVLDTTELEKRVVERQYDLDIDDLLKHILDEEKKND